VSPYAFTIDPDLLATFLTVADAGRVLAAAPALHLSQPAVTARIRRLERQAGAPLFLRSARGVSLTPAGRRLYETARRVHGLLEESVRGLSPAAEDSGPLELAASTTVAGQVLPPLLADFVRARPGGVTLRVGNTEEVLGWVAEGRVPLGLVEGLARHAKARLEAFAEDEIVPCRAPGGPGAPRRPRDLAGATILWRERGSGTRAVVERALKRAGLPRAALRAAHELGSTEAIKGAVVAGLGVGFLSRWSIRAELALGRLEILPIPSLFVPRTFRWALPSGSLSGPALSFYRFARARPAPRPV
jgi:DNA-binding transcriptional LysR family regulator